MKSVSDKPRRKYLTNYWLISWRPYVIIILIGAAIFGRTIWYEYTYFDDDYLILKQYESINDLSKVGQAFKSLYLGPYYRPIVTTSLILDAQISKNAPWMYHSSNIIYHLITSCLLFLFLLKLQFPRAPALIMSILFTVHPLVTQAVVWIPGRNDSLLAIFVLFSLITFLQFRARKRLYIFIIHIISLLSALLTKETAIILPIIILCYILLIARDPILTKQNIVCVFGWFLIIIVWYFLRSSALTLAHTQSDTYSFTAFVSNIRVLLELFGKIFLPCSLSAYPTYSDVPTYFGLAMLIGIVIILFCTKGSVNRLILFSIIWIVSFSLPSMIVRLFEAEHRFAYLESRFYVSIIGFPILLSGILQIYPRILKWVRNSIFIIILCLYITITLSYSTNFRNPLLHWNHVIDMSPRSADAHFNMGIVLMDVANNPQLAVESYKRAIALNPLNSQYHNNLGIIYGRLGLLIQAEDEFRTSIGINRSDPLPHCNLGYVYYLNHDILEAEKQWKKALTLDSNFTEVLMKLMNLYLQEKKYEQAKYYYQKLQKLSISVDSTILTHF